MEKGVITENVCVINILKMKDLSKKINNFNKKQISDIKNSCTFALTVPVLLPIRTAHWSFFKDSTFTNNNTPPMPLHDAHLGGFLFL